MSNLFKSKTLKAVLGLTLAVFMFAGFAGVASKAGATKVASAQTVTYDFGTTTVKAGALKSAVKAWQSFFNNYAGTNLVVDGLFGAKSTVAAKAWQTSQLLAADGLLGKNSRAAAAVQIAGGVVVPPVGGVAGCPAGAVTNSITGLPCTTATTLDAASVTAGCKVGDIYSGSASPAFKCVYVGGTVPPVVATGPVSVALAIDNPASGSFIVPASGVQFAKYTFTGAGTVTSVKLQRTGVSASTTVSNVYLYDGATRLTDGASIGSDNTVTFNAPGGLFTVAGSKTITVVADTLVADYSLGFRLIGYTANGTASVVSVSGNEMYGASATLAIVTMTSATGSGNTDAGVDIPVWQGTATVATRDTLLKSLALRQIGSIAAADINNFKLYADGVLIASTAALDSNGYVTFSPSAVLKTGARTLKVTADVIGGSGRTVQFSLRGAYDILATDTQYNANGTAAGTFPFGPAVFTVNAGTLTVVKKADSPSTNLTLGASDQNLATYTFTAYGEPIKVENLHVGIINTGGGATSVSLRNVRILVNGAQVGSNTTVPAETAFLATTGTSFTTNFIVYPGTPATIEIHSDIFDNEGTDEIATPGVTAIQAVLVGGTSSSNGVPQVSITAINVPTATNVAGNSLTISSGSMTVAKTSSYASRSVSVPQTAYKVGSFQLSGNSTEAVNLNTLYVGFADTTTDAAPATDLSDIYVVYGGTMTTVKGTVTCTYASGCTNPNTWSINKTLAKNEIMQIDVYASIGSTLTTSKSFITTLAVAGTTANSGIATYADSDGTITTLVAGKSGQEITSATGSITISLDGSTALAQIVDDGSTVKSLTAKVVAITDSYTLTEFTVTVSDVSAVSTVTLKDHVTGAILGAAKSAQTSLTWTGLEIPVAAGDTKTIDVELALSPVGVSAGSTGALLTTVITAFTARDSAGLSAAGLGSPATGNAVYVYKAIPTISLLALPTSILSSASTPTLAKFTVSTNGTGTVAWNRMIFTITKTTAPTLASFTLWNADGNSQVLGTATIVEIGTNAATCTTGLACAVRFVPNAEQQVSGATTYILKATQAAAVSTGDYVSTSILNPGATLAFVASDTYPNVAATGSFSATTYTTYLTSPSFIWSDVSAAAHATSVSTDWSNDYLVKSLPLDSQTITK